MRLLSGKNDGQGIRVGIVVAMFNDYVTRMLLEGALDRLRDLGVADSDITVVWVPGSFEIPVAAKRLASDPMIDSVLTLGSVIKGDTAHFDFVGLGVTQGVSRVGLDTGKPVIFGVLTTYNTAQAVERADPKQQNLGGEYAQAAVEMANLTKSLDQIG